MKSIPESRWSDGLMCRKCRTIVVSLSRHDFRECKCGAIFVDGGFDYFRHGGEEDEMLYVKVHFPQQPRRKGETHKAKR